VENIRQRQAARHVRISRRAWPLCDFMLRRRPSPIEVALRRKAGSCRIRKPALIPLHGQKGAANFRTLRVFGIGLAMVALHKAQGSNAALSRPTF
jgi:hypothetical protein